MALFGKKADITIATERPVYMAGEMVSAKVRIVGEKGLLVTRGDVELVSSTRYKVRQRDNDPGDSGYEYVWHTDDVVLGGQMFMENAPLEDGQVIEHDVSFVIPREAPPSGKGSITTVQWEIRVRLAVRGFDAKAGAIIGVLSAPSYAMAVTHQPPVHHADDCVMELSLENRSATGGGGVRGTVTITPHAELKAKRLRLRLERFESVPARAGNSSIAKVAEPVLKDDLGTLAAGVPVSFPFAIPLPPDVCPTMTTRVSSVGWRLVAEVDRRLRKDEEVEVSLNVYSAYHLAPDSGY